MMRCISCVVLVLASLIVVPAASADPITFSDTFDPANVFFVSSGSACTGTNGVTDSTSASTCQTLSWTHLLPGFNALTDTLTSATLSLWFYDDGDNAAEKVDVTLEENVFYNNQTI